MQNTNEQHTAKLRALVEEDPKLLLLSKGKLQSALKKHGIPSKVYDEYFASRESTEVLSKPKKLKASESLKIVAQPYLYQIDIVEYPAYADANGGKTKFLLLLEMCSRKAFAYLLNKGDAPTVLAAYKTFVEAGYSIKSVQGDAFFDNKIFKEYNASNGIYVRTSVAKDDHMCGCGNKLGLIDRCVRTLKQYMSKKVLETGDVKWSKWLPEILELYNGTPHSALKGRTPSSVYGDTGTMIDIMVDAQFHNMAVKDKWDIEEGDQVRVLVGREEFGKEKAPYSVDTYIVKGVEGNVFVLEDATGKEVSRRYKYAELMKSSTSVVQKVAPQQGAKKARERTKVKKVLKNKEGIVRDLREATKATKDAKTKKAIAKRLLDRAKPARDWWKADPVPMKRAVKPPSKWWEGKPTNQSDSDDD